MIDVANDKRNKMSKEKKDKRWDNGKIKQFKSKHCAMSEEKSNKIKKSANVLPCITVFTVVTPITYVTLVILFPLPLPCMELINLEFGPFCYSTTFYPLSLLPFVCLILFAHFVHVYHFWRLSLLLCYVGRNDEKFW